MPLSHSDIYRHTTSTLVVVVVGCVDELIYRRGGTLPTSPDLAIWCCNNDRVRVGAPLLLTMPGI